MKQKRIIVKGLGVYHVFNRTAYARFTLDEAEREMFVTLMRKQAAFSGIEVLSFCVLSNHYHMLVRVPNERTLDDAELLARYRILYQDDPAPKTAMRPSDLEAVLTQNQEKAQELRKQLHLRMHSLPVFMKELQQRFGIWYNMTHDNKGTLWSERFRSVLVENNPQIMRVVAAYIELNPVRAGIADHPKEFRWCSLHAALRGDPNARLGICKVVGYHDDFQRSLSIYTRHIDTVCGHQQSRRDPAHPAEARVEISAEDDPSTSTSLRSRVAGFTRGAILGTAAFVRRFRKEDASTFGIAERKNAAAHHVLTASHSGLFSLRKGTELQRGSE